MRKVITSTIDLNCIHSLQKEYLRDEKEINKVEPLVSVWVITYQHMNFIAKCLEGILTQKTNFPFEIVLGEDQSTDGTRELCIEYAEKNTDKIRLFLRDRKETALYDNKGVFFKSINGILTIKSCRGKYIAMCEGDDYWTDPDKLQKQFNFLEANPNYVICSHDMNAVDENGAFIESFKLPDEVKKSFSSEELIKAPWIPTLTRFFRNVVKDLPDEYIQMYYGDTFIMSLLGHAGKGKFLTDVKPAIYRKHSTSTWSGLDDIKKMFISGHTSLWIHYYYERIKEQKYSDYFKKIAIDYYFTKALTMFEANPGHEQEEIIRKIFTEYTEVIDSVSERKLKKILKTSNLFIERSKCESMKQDAYRLKEIACYPDAKQRGLITRDEDEILLDQRKSAYQIKNQDYEHLDKLCRQSANAILDRWLTQKGWENKKILYTKYFETVTFLKSVQQPAISVIVVSWRLHRDSLKNFQILEQQRNQHFELVLLDNGGKLGEMDSLKLFVDTYVRLNANTGVCLARNVGALFAKAPILFFLDDDCFPSDNLLSAHIAQYSCYDIVCARGAIKPKTSNRLNKKAIHYYLGPNPFPIYPDTGGNFSIRAGLFFKIGGWDDRITFGCEEVDLSRRIIDIEPDLRKQIYNPEAVIYHDYAVDNEHLAEKMKKQEESRRYIRQKHPDYDNFLNMWKPFWQRPDTLIKIGPAAIERTSLDQSVTQSKIPIPMKDPMRYPTFSNADDTKNPVHRESPLITVIMAAHNAGAHLNEAVRSILEQTFQDFEIIIINDASIDETEKILERFTDPRMMIIRNSKNIGPAGSRNEALAIARGNYIAIVDADDLSLPMRFESQLNFLESNPDYALVGSYAYQIDESGQYLSVIKTQTANEEIRKVLVLRNNFVHGSVMIRRSVLLEMGGYDKRFKYAHDYDLFLRIAERYQIANLSEPLYCWRSSSSQISSSRKKEQDDYAEMARQEAIERQFKKVQTDSSYLKTRSPTQNETICKTDEDIHDSRKIFDSPIPQRDGFEQIRIMELERSLQDVYNSRGWKFLVRYYKLRDLLVRKAIRLFGVFKRM